MQQGVGIVRKTRLAAAVAVTASLSLLAACGGGSAEGGGEDEAVTLRVGTGLSDKHAWWAAGMVPWMENVEELTDGQVTFETFTGGELVEVTKEIEAVQNGTVDVALMLPIYNPDQFPMAEVTMLPISKSDTMIASQAWKALLESQEQLSDGKTYYESQFGAQDIKAWPLSTTQEYAISTTGDELDSVQAVESLSLRTPSRIHEMYAAKIGVDSVTIPAVEMFDALSRGAFDGSFYSVADWSGYGFQDLFKYTLTDINFGHFNGLIGMSQQAFDELPADVQEAMQQAHEETFEGSAQEWLDRADEMVEYNEGKGGKFVSFGTLDQPVQDHMLSGVEETWTDYIELLEKDGLPGKDVALLWRDLLVEAGGEVPDGIARME
jgi:TRAP-type C4-dicarboxylate transport system substrate-binding protein